MVEYLLRDGSTFVGHFSPAAYVMVGDEREAHRFATRKLAREAAQKILRARERDGRPAPRLELVPLPPGK